MQGKPFVDKDSTNIIERFHGTMKDRTNVIRGFKNMEKANLLTDAWIVHYNFFKEHEALGNVPPAQKMETPTPFKDWNDVLKSVKTDMVKTRKVEVVSLASDIITKSRPKLTMPKLRTPRQSAPKRRQPKGDLYIGRGMMSRHPFKGSKPVKLR